MTALVGNTDPDHRMGQHWAGIYIDVNIRGDYYDPTGRPPFFKGLREFHEETLSYLDIQHRSSTGRRIYRVRTSLHFYLIHRCVGHSMTDVTKLSENPVEATTIVQNFALLLAKHVL